MHPVIPYLIAALLFGIGVYGVLVRRNAVLLLMSIELMLNAVNLVFVTADSTIVGVPRSGQVFALFVIVLAAAEVGVGLAVILRLFRLRATVLTDGLAAADSGPDGTGSDAASPDPDAGTVPPVATGARPPVTTRAGRPDETGGEVR